MEKRMEKTIAEKLSKAAVLEQMAEEAAELCQAALKLARILRGENPTPVSEEDAALQVNGEMADVEVCADVLAEHGIIGHNVVWEIYNNKMERWLKRLEEKEN